MTSMVEILNGRNPQVIVFDCDWTLYPYDCGKHRLAPFEATPHGILDYWGRWANAYPDYPDTYIVEQPETPSWVWVALGGALLLLLMRNN